MSLVGDSIGKIEELKKKGFIYVCTVEVKNFPRLHIVPLFMYLEQLKDAALNGEMVFICLASTKATLRRHYLYHGFLNLGLDCPGCIVML